MSKKIEVATLITVEALGPDEAEDPIIYIRFDDYPEEQVVVIFTKEVEGLVTALTEAAAWQAGQDWRMGNEKKAG